MKTGNIHTPFIAGIALMHLDTYSKSNHSIQIYQGPNEKATYSFTLLASLNMLKEFIDYYNISTQVSFLIQNYIDIIISKNYVPNAKLHFGDKSKLGFFLTFSNIFSVSKGP